MTKEQDAMELALSELVDKICPGLDTGDLLADAATASKSIDIPPAAQPEQEPVAWMYQCTADTSGPVLLLHKTNWAESGTGLWIETPLYTAPQQRPWVGLTDEERDAIEAATLDLHGVPKFFATAIEAKLKEKNK